jgi:magnesium transporter
MILDRRVAIGRFQNSQLALHSLLLYFCSGRRALMTKTKKRGAKQVGLPPGTLVHVGEQKTERIKITLTDYDEAGVREKEIRTPEECYPYRDRPTVTWINMDGLHQVEAVAKIGQHFGLHPLVLEDIVHTEQRPKLEDFGQYVFIVTKMLSYDEKLQKIKAEQISFVLSANFVLTFQEGGEDDFAPVRARLKNENNRLRKLGTDYLLYTLLDAVVDNYFVVLDKIGEKIEEVEEVLLTREAQANLPKLHSLRREMILLRKSIWPLREVITFLARPETSLVKEATAIYLRDLYDHTVRVIESVENNRDLLSVLMDIYLTSLSNRMNEVMKTLTIISTIFMPLTFIAGVYGMNFAHMPELQWRWGYPLILALMLALGIGMVFFFKKRKWV